MSILLIISLGTIIVMALVSILTGGNLDVPLSQDTINPRVNSTNTELALFNLQESFYIDELTGALVILISVIGIAVLIGIRVLNSGLSDQAQGTMTTVVFYVALWLVFSALSNNLIQSIEVIGSILYIILTIAFAIGVFQKVQKNE